jgi:hypothetical protein
LLALGSMKDPLEQLVQRLNEGRPAGGHKIDRVRLDEFQILVGTDAFEVTCYTSVDLVRGAELVFSMKADFRERDRASFDICNLVGKHILRCSFQNGEFAAELETGDQLILRRARDFENFVVTAFGDLPLIA